MMSEVSEMVLESSSEIRCVTVRRNRKLIFQKSDRSFDIITRTSQHLCSFNDKSIHLVSSYRSSRLKVKITCP